MNGSIRFLGALLLASTAWAQDDPPTEFDSSQMPAEVMPLSEQSLLLDLTEASGRWVAVGERGHVLISDDGQSWRQSDAVPTRSTLTAVTAVGDELWAVGHDVVVLHSADRGETWAIQQADASMMQPLLGVHFVDASNGIAVGAYGYYLSTSDGGQTWEEGMTMSDGGEDDLDEGYEEEPLDEEEGEESEPSVGNYDFSDFEDEITDFHMNGVEELADGTLYIAAEAGTGLRSTDGGQSWQRIELPYEGSMFGALVAADGTLITYGLRGHVLESDDGGRTWIEQETGTLNSLLGGTVLADGTVALVGANGEVLLRDPDTGRYQSTRTAAGDDLAAALPSGEGELVLVGEGGITRHAVTGATP